ncbi:hypothetical protein PSY31_23745, partial [Shigella flexneri]|nr:hypothetical protein [Shigella flexneri]
NSGSKARKESYKKAGKSLTTILTARSKVKHVVSTVLTTASSYLLQSCADIFHLRSQAACGLTKKPKDLNVVDIDAADLEN